MTDQIDVLDIISLMSVSEIHNRLTIADIPRLILAPVLLGQYQLWRDDSTPVAYASWGYLSDDAKGRHLARAGLFRAEDWKSGPELWFLDFIAPYGNVTGYVRDLYRLFPDRKFAFTSRSYGTGSVQRLGNYRNG